jgi:co-chaperonin GroES (HSP10)
MAIKKATAIKPKHYQIVFKPFTRDEYEETRTKSGLIISTQEDKADDFAQNEGVLVAKGEKAFFDWDEKERPQIGDRIFTRMYPGLVKYINGEIYRVCADTDVLATTITDGD